MLRVAGRRSRASPNSRSASCGSNGALSTNPRHPRISAAGLLVRAVAYRMQEVALGGFRPERQRQLRQFAQQFKETGEIKRRARLELKSGTRLVREWRGRTYEVLVLEDGFSWQGARYRSLSAVARKITGTPWSGPLFFGLKQNRPVTQSPSQIATHPVSPARAAMPRTDAGRRRCAIYTRKSSEEGLEQDFNSLDAQREACEAFIRSQATRAGSWPDRLRRRRVLRRQHGAAGPATLARRYRARAHRHRRRLQGRPADPLARRFRQDWSNSSTRNGVSFVSVTQQFNTTTSMGRLTLNVLLSFAQFEREVTGERIRDKIAASKKKGMWMGGNVPLGYDASRAHAGHQPCRGREIACAVYFFALS